MIKDISHDLTVTCSANVTVSGNGTLTGTTIDTKDTDCGLFFAVRCSAYTDGSHVVSAQESDDDSVWTDVDSSQLVTGSVTVSAATTADASLSTIGLVGTKRYVRHKVVSTGVTTGATLQIIRVSTGEILPK